MDVRLVLQQQQRTHVHDAELVVAEGIMVIRVRCPNSMNVKLLTLEQQHLHVHASPQGRSALDRGRAGGRRDAGRRGRY
jgi:hypothetical protein